MRMQEVYGIRSGGRLCFNDCSVGNGLCPGSEADRVRRSGSFAEGVKPLPNE